CADPRAETAVDPDLGPHSFARGCNVGMDQAFVEVRITTLRRSASGADDRNRADRDEADVEVLSSPAHRESERGGRSRPHRPDRQAGAYRAHPRTDAQCCAPTEADYP